MQLTRASAAVELDLVNRPEPAARGLANLPQAHGREGRRLGEAPPVAALRDVAAHAIALRPRMQLALDGHSLVVWFRPNPDIWPANRDGGAR